MVSADSKSSVLKCFQNLASLFFYLKACVREGIQTVFVLFEMLILHEFYSFHNPSLGKKNMLVTVCFRISFFG